MIIAVTLIVITFALIGAVVGMLISFMFAIDVTPTALIGALSGGLAGFIFLLNAKANGGKGL